MEGQKACGYFCRRWCHRWIR